MNLFFQQLNFLFMRHFKIFTLIAVLVSFIISCGQDDNKKKELELKEKELQLKEKELKMKEDSIKNSSANNSVTLKDNSSPVEKKCDSKYQLAGKLIGVYSEGSYCQYVYLKILTDDGKELYLFLDGNPDNFKINSQKFFNWSEKKINNFLENDNEGIKFPNDAFDANYINKTYLFCCYKDKVNCGDDPNSPKQYFCKQILEK